MWRPPRFLLWATQSPSTVPSMGFAARHTPTGLVLVWLSLRHLSRIVFRKVLLTQQSLIDYPGQLFQRSSYPRSSISAFELRTGADLGTRYVLAGLMEIGVLPSYSERKLILLDTTGEMLGEVDLQGFDERSVAEILDHIRSRSDAADLKQRLGAVTEPDTRQAH